VKVDRFGKDTVERALDSAYSSNSFSIVARFNDGFDRKVELLAGETASLIKGSDGSVTSFQKGKIAKNSVNSKYEDGGNLFTDKMINKNITVTTGGTMIDETGTEVHDNRDGLKKPKK